MKIIMMSDMHISCTSDIKRIKYLVERMSIDLEETLIPNEEVIILSCGDIINGGVPEAFSKAIEVYDYIKKKFDKWNVSFEFIPGNHDLCGKSLKEFDNFIRKYQATPYSFFYENSHSREINGLNFILTSSVSHRDWQYGMVDFKSIESKLSNQKDNVLVVHHSPLSEDIADSANIRDAKKLFRMPIQYILHGHTHGESVFDFGSLLIGVGPMFITEDNINNQFNLIDINYGEIASVYNYWFRKDYDHYLKKKTFPKSDDKEKRIKSIIKREYSRPQKYIQRKVAPYKFIQEGSISLYFNREDKKTLLDICLEKKHVVLLGEAGCGKTVEVAYLAYQISSMDYNYYPVYISLNTYTNENICDLIPTEYNRLNMNEMFFIFDGFDEIEPQCLNIFARKLNVFAKENQDTLILVTSRNNFYKNTLDEKISGTLSSFFEYGICKLSTADIKNYLLSQKVDINNFYREIKSKNLNDLIIVPFYLIELVVLFKEYENLPTKTTVMDILIESRFRFDGGKYKTTIDMEDSEYELNKLLQQLAFALQCTQKNYFTNKEYQSLFNDKQRMTLKYSGIWIKDAKNNWLFQHNNFREYLVAKYLYEEPLETIINFITYPDNREEIKPSWINTLSYLVLIYSSDELLEWLKSTSPSIIVKFEPHRIDEITRQKVFIDIFELYKNKNMWISWNISDEAELALFGQGPDTVDYLLNEIQNPIHFRSLSNSLHLIRNFTNLFGKEKEVEEVLLCCCKRKETRTYEINNAIISLSNLRLNSEEVTTSLLELFETNNDSEVRYGLYCYLLESKQQDEYIDYFIRGIELRENDQNYAENGSETFRLIEGLKSVESFESIKKILTYYTKKRFSINLYHSEEVFEEICTTAKTLYLNGYTELFDIILDNFFVAYNNFELKYLISIRKFFESTKTTKKAYLKILFSQAEKDLLYLLEEIMDSECVDDFAERYLHDQLDDKELFISYVKRLSPVSHKFNKLKSYVFEKDNIIIEKSENINDNKVQVIGKQNFFNSLFEKDKFNSLLEELINISGNLQITYEELKHINYRITEKRYDLKKIKWSICNSKFKDKSVKDFLNYINWNNFSILNIYEVLKDEPAELQINDDQFIYIREYCNNSISHINFDTAIQYKEDGSYTYSISVLLVVFFSNYFDFEYDKKILQDMLMIPAFMFSKKEINNNEFSTYITTKLSKQEIVSHVSYNILHKKLVGDVAGTHLEYCKNNNLSVAIPLAERICDDNVSQEHIKRKAFEYLFKIMGEKYIYERLLSKADDCLLKIIVDNLYQNENEELEKILIEKNESSEDSLLYLTTLIKMNSTFGVETYLKLSKEKNAIPDYSEEEGNIYPLTESIERISELKLLPIVSELIELLFQDGFKDKPSFGLYRSLNEALKNLSIGNYEIISRELQKILKNNSSNLELCSFCNNNLENIKNEHYKFKDNPWSIKQIKDYFHNSNKLSF